MIVLGFKNERTKMFRIKLTGKDEAEIDKKIGDKLAEGYTLVSKGRITENWIPKYLAVMEKKDDA